MCAIGVQLCSSKRSELRSGWGGRRAGLASGSHRGTRSSGVSITAAHQTDVSCFVCSPERCLLRCNFDVPVIVMQQALLHERQVRVTCVHI